MDNAIQERSAIKKLLEFILTKLNQEMIDLEGVHIGSAYKSVEQLATEISLKASKVLVFLNYAGWWTQFLTDDKTIEEFIDWQLDQMNDPSTSEDRKEFIRKGLDEFYCHIS